MKRNSQAVVRGIWAHMPALMAVALYALTALALLDNGAHHVAFRVDNFIKAILATLLYFLVSLVISMLLLMLFVKGRYQLMLRAWHGIRDADWIELVLLRIPLALAVFTSVGYIYVIFKINIPYLTNYDWDFFFAWLDRLVFLGTDPWEITHEIFSSSAMTGLIDNLYLLWFIEMKVVTIAVACLPLRSHLRLTYLLAFVLSAALCGSLIAILMAAAGPVYLEPLSGSTMFKPLMDRLYEQAAQVNIAALSIQERLWQGYVDPSVEPMGISAFPSVHVEYAALCAIFGFAVHRVLGWALAAYAALMFLGSVHLGWHYAVDGIAGIFLAVAIWWVSARVTGWWLERTEPSRDKAALPAE